MNKLTLPNTLAQMFSPVKSANSAILSPANNPMIHHKVPISITKPIIVSYSNLGTSPYGVSRSQRIITPSLFIKKFDYIRDCLQRVLGLTTAQREVALRLLRLWAYYGLVYPKEATITEEPGCKKATFWRTIRLLKDDGLITVHNRYVLRPHAQISNLYRLDRLALVIAKYLAEHIAYRWPEYLGPVLRIPWPDFWSVEASYPRIRAGPSG